MPGVFQLIAARPPHLRRHRRFYARLDSLDADPFEETVPVRSARRGGIQGAVGVLLGYYYFFSDGLRSIFGPSAQASDIAAGRAL